MLFGQHVGKKKISHCNNTFFFFTDHSWCTWGLWEKDKDWKRKQRKRRMKVSSQGTGSQRSHGQNHSTLSLVLFWGSITSVCSWFYQWIFLKSFVGFVWLSLFGVPALEYELFQSIVDLVLEASPDVGPRSSSEGQLKDCNISPTL